MCVWCVFVCACVCVCVCEAVPGGLFVLSLLLLTTFFSFIHGATRPLEDEHVGGWGIFSHS